MMQASTSNFGTFCESLDTLNSVRLRMTPYKPSEILGMGQTVEVCSMLHDVVIEFRHMHGGLQSELAAGTCDPVELYPLVTAPLDQVAAIAHLSDPTTYAAMRHGGRFQSPYPPLDDDTLRECCRELRAALVWKSRVSTDSPPAV